MSEWSVRRKVVAVLLIPVVLAAVFGGLRVRTELKDANDFHTNQQRATVLGPVIDYLSATERLALPSSLADQMGDGSGSPDAAYKTAETNLKSAAAKSHLTASENKDVRDMLSTGTTLATGSGTGITATAPVQLSSMTRLATDLINSTLNSQGNQDAKVQGLIQSLNGRLSLSKQQLLIQSNAQESSLLGSVWLAAEIGVESTALDTLRSAVGGHRVSVLISDNGTRLGLATSNKVDDLAATPRMFTVYDGLSDHLLGSIQDQLAADASHAKSRALTDAAIILVALLASLILALFVARALIVPLRKVRAGALEVANERLPETVARIRSGHQPDEFTPIPVHSHEELGQLARAVDDMHKQAVNLATGEAQLRAQVGAMFVTLSRRNTTLVNQQLALIESLEQDEEDPQRLEQLFSLDHLATRMRRTAESLVILGGTEGRTASFEELSVSDVVHAAVSEVQDYQRVRIDAAPDRMIGGRAASDVVHLMAELIDNALSYSPPGSPVTIRATEEESKVTIEIVDNGLGMAGDALAQANDALKRGGEVTVDTARRMGLFVVSRLAEDHDLKVKLRRNSNGGGIIASITLPASVLVTSGPVEHVSIMDAPEQVEETAPVVDDEPEEEYDPYLERIEDAIAAVTGLPRRRPGQAPGPAAPVAPAVPVGMFEAPANPELPAAFEPTELPSGADTFASRVDADPLNDPLEGPLADPLNDPLTSPLVAESSEHQEAPETLSVDAELPSGADTFASRVDADPLNDPLDGPLSDPLNDPLTSPLVAESAEHQEAPETLSVDAEHLTADEHEADEHEVDEHEADEHEVDEHDEADEHDEHELAEVVTPDFGADRSISAESEQPSAEEPVDEPVAPVAEVSAPVAEVDEHVADQEPAAELAEPAYDAPVEAPAASVAPVPEPASVPVEEAPVRLQIRRSLSAAAGSALEGDYVPETSRAGSPIFGQLRSNWLSDDENEGQAEQGEQWTANEVDRGWNAAERAESADAEGTTSTGLPVRRPGGRLLPGGVSQEPAKVVRDPEAIRNRLAAHAAGVSRGRAAAAAEPFTDDYAHEETGPA